MKEIRGHAENLRSLLSGTKFSIDYYQREYRWATKQVVELIDDLVENFNDNYDSSHERSAVEDYGHYFLGSIIISNKDGRKFIIDGQQRLTTLSLLLIHVYRLLEDDEQKGQMSDLIFSMKFGRRSFNLDVKERAECMDALFTGKTIDESRQSESVVNILHRFQDVIGHFPDKLRCRALPYFADWLIENVHLVEITAYSDADAYTIFETMNDRGLSLTPTDMLKGYLLANIKDPGRRNAANELWRKQVATLHEYGKEEEADAIKAWLRGQHAKSIRERRRGADPLDFDRIGTEFHRWVRDNANALGLSSSGDFARFIEDDFAFYGRWYTRLRRAADTMTEGLESVHYCAQHSYTLQYPVLLAALRREDSDQDQLRKLRIVSTYLDILIARRIWNWRAISYSTMQYAMFLVMCEVRDKDALALAAALTRRLSQDDEALAFHDGFYLHGTNGPHVYRLLARLTEYAEVSSGRSSHYAEYMNRSSGDRYEIEHIWSNNFDNQRRQEFGHRQDFSDYRNRIGGLLLLPRSFNASYGALPYEEKREHYLKQNLLAQSLHDSAYERDPGFIDFVQSRKLPFGPHPQFRKEELDARQDLYRRIAEEIWNPGRLVREAES